MLLVISLNAVLAWTLAAASSLIVLALAYCCLDAYLHKVRHPVAAPILAAALCVTAIVVADALLVTHEEFMLQYAKMKMFSTAALLAVAAGVCFTLAIDVHYVRDRRSYGLLLAIILLLFTSLIQYGVVWMGW